MESPLIIRPAAHDDLKTTMPMVTCGTCGLSAQIPAAHFGVEHWDDLYEGHAYSDEQLYHDRELEDWLHNHACGK